LDKPFKRQIKSHKYLMSIKLFKGFDITQNGKDTIKNDKIGLTKFDIAPNVHKYNKIDNIFQL